MDKLPILALETSGINCSVALMTNIDVLYEFNIYKKFVHSEKLMHMIDQLLTTADIKLKQVGHIAVSEGPGSFTGLRIGYAAAKGLALGADLPIVFVPTYDAAAYNICSIMKDGASFSIANNVNANEIYFAGYRKRGKYFDKLHELSLVDKKEFESVNAEFEYSFGDYILKDPQHRFDGPSAQIISKWSYFFGKDLLNSNFDYVEPKYLKNFTPKKPKVKL
jgi:tRNA threonylcarbamoyl adenosine modification protein YeaZ